VSWQVALGLCLYVGWVGLHSWLGKKRLTAVLVTLIIVELLTFAGIWVWMGAQDYDVSAGMALGLVIFGAAAALLVPALVGALSLFKNRQTAF
jgi:hypothetical protein